MHLSKLSTSYIITCSCGTHYVSDNKYGYHYCKRCNKVYNDPIKTLYITEEPLEKVCINCKAICPNCNTENYMSYGLNGYCQKCKLLFSWNGKFPQWQIFNKKSVDGKMCYIIFHLAIGPTNNYKRMGNINNI